MKSSRFWLSVSFVLALLLAGARHVNLIVPLVSCAHGERSRFLRESFVWRLRCITLGGGFARWGLGHRRCNDVYLSPGEVLVRPLPRGSARGFTSSVLPAMRILKSRGIPVLYVQVPDKQGMDGCGFPRAFGDNLESRYADEVLADLSGEFRCIDLRPVVAGTAEAIRANFFRTDHHWTFEGAFKAFRHLIPETLKEIGVDASLAAEPLDRGRWTAVDVPRPQARFLGSLGRRTGPWFAGFDRLHYLVPAFETDLKAEIRSRKNETVTRQGDFRTVFENSNAIVPPVTWYEDYGYDVYLGDQACVDVVNPAAPVKKTVFVVKNSYFQPLIAWMTTVFSRVIAVDPRHDRGRFLEEVCAARPDCVLLAEDMGTPDYFLDEGQTRRP